MKINLDNVEEIEYLPGFHGRMVHSDKLTLAYWTIEQGASLPEHAHPHEQAINMMAGQLQMMIGGEKYHFGPGDIFIIPSNVPHSGKAITACKILDVFTPAREEYK